MMPPPPAFGKDAQKVCVSEDAVDDQIASGDAP
jgi:hypothetical protein